jgi:hypothetical protein
LKLYILILNLLVHSKKWVDIFPLQISNISTLVATAQDCAQVLCTNIREKYSEWISIHLGISFKDRLALYYTNTLYCILKYLIIGTNLGWFLFNLSCSSLCMVNKHPSLTHLHIFPKTRLWSNLRTEFLCLNTYTFYYNIYFSYLPENFSWLITAFFLSYFLFHSNWK